MLCQKLVEKLGRGVEGETVMLYKSLLLKSLHIVPKAVFIVLFIIIDLQRVQQIEVKISRAGALEADPELPLTFFFI